MPLSNVRAYQMLLGLPLRDNIKDKPKAKSLCIRKLLALPQWISSKGPSAREAVIEQPGRSSNARGLGRDSSARQSWDSTWVEVITPILNIFRAGAREQVESHNLYLHI